MKEKIDLRITKTRKSMIDALIELFEEKTLEELNVSIICEKANINRTTFYEHFKDKIKLYNYLMEKLKNDLYITEEKESLNEYLDYINECVVEYIYNKKQILVRLLPYNQFIIINEILNTKVREKINENIQKFYEGNIPTEILSSHFIGSLINVILSWLKYPDYTKEEIIEFLKALRTTEI